MTGHRRGPAVELYERKQGRGRLVRACHALGLAALLAPGVLVAQRGQADEFAPAQLVPPPRDAWRTNGGNLYNQRYSATRTLDPSNVAGLKGVWRTHLRGSGLPPQYSGEAQPLVHDGRILVITGADDVFALSVETGEILWQHAAELDPKIASICCGWTSRGVGLGAGKVFVGQLDGKLLALDEKTGKQIWSVQAERWEQGFSLTNAPLYYAGLVITGFSGAEIGVRGRVKAFDAKTGKLVWTFYTVPGPGERGHETWPKDSEVWKHGGATVWQTPAVDPELGLLYFSTGNPGPDFNGAVRAGDNLYSDSIVALEAKTGKYRWHFQQVHHDLWDYDAPNPIVLFDVEIGGVIRKALGEVGKTGWAYILDRATGEPLIGIDERPVPQEPRQATAATQPYPRGDAIVPQQVDIPPEGYKLVNEGRIFTPFVGADGMIVNPSLYGGANWPPSSYDPERHLLFVCASSVVGNFVGGDRDFEIPREGAHYEGGVVGFAALPRSGIFAALDVTLDGSVLQRLGRDRRRARVRGPQRRPAHRARVRDRRAALGVPDRRRHECPGDGVRARRQAVRRRVLGRQSARRNPARRQRVAVRPRRHAAAGDAARFRDADHLDFRAGAVVDRSGPARRGGERPRGLHASLRRVPRRGRQGRTRRRHAAHVRADRRLRGGDRHIRAQQHAAVRLVAQHGANPRRERVRRRGARETQMIAGAFR